MRDELLAYLLDDLSASQRLDIEKRIAADPRWQQELERLRACLPDSSEPSSSKTEDDTSPQNLVQQTCSLVQQARSQAESQRASQNAAPAVARRLVPTALTESQDTPCTRFRCWTLVDFSMAAGLLLLLGTLVAPALKTSRELARRTQCQEKLSTLGMTMARYAEQTSGRLPAIERDENAGMYAVKLLESGLLTQEQLAERLICPATQLAEDVFRGVTRFRIPSRQQLQSATPEQRALLRAQMGGSFAYRVGYFDPQGEYHQVDFLARSTAPVMADAPNFELAAFQSTNHGGCGQNVLFQDCSVRYYTICKQQGQDQNWFLNAEGQHAAGKHPLDIVMIRSESSPLGRRP